MNVTYPTYVENKYIVTPFYRISLEAWRRGLTVTFTENIKQFRVSSTKNSYFFVRSMVVDPDLGERAREICKYKDQTKQYLKKAQIPVPEGRRFPPEFPHNEIIGFAEQTGFPVVIKPVNGFRGEGVFPNVTDAATMKKILHHLCHELKYDDIIVEERVEGNEYRIFVLGDRVVAALRKTPLHVTGNGKDTIRDLVLAKNNERSKNFIKRKSIIIDDEMLLNVKEAGYHIKSILNENQILFLRKKNNFSVGGDSEDVTDELPGHLKSTAVKAVAAIPGLYHAGVDIIHDEARADSPSVVIEINALAEIGAHLHPRIGKGRDIPSALIDHYFPESIGARHRHRMFYYDPVPLIEKLRKNPKTPITLSLLPPEEMERQDIMVTGRVQGVAFRQWARKQAIALQLSGYVENQGRAGVHMVVAGDKKRVKEFSELCKTGPPRTKVDNVSVSASDEAIVTGFRIINKENRLLSTFRNLPRSIARKVKKLKNRLM